MTDHHDYTDTDAVQLLAALNHYAECFSADRPTTVVELVTDLVQSISTADLSRRDVRIVGAAQRLYTPEAFAEVERDLGL